MEGAMEHQPTMAQRSVGSIDVQSRIERIQRLTRWLDSSIDVPGSGFTIGWDTIIGLVPGVGDLFSTALSGWIINEARLLGVSRMTLARMVANSAFDTVVGSVPLAGDLFDAAFKANVKNLSLIERSLKRQGLIVADEASD